MKESKNIYFKSSNYIFRYENYYHEQVEENRRIQASLDSMKEAERVKIENYQKMKRAFERSQEIIENKHFEESKKYIEKYIANVFLKEFIIENDKKIEFKISLISFIKNFTQEFMNYCNQFLNSFKSNTDKIILEFDIKEIEPIEHINMIVIGKTGIGKSTFINESLLLDKNKRAEEGKGLPVTNRSNVYTSDILKMIRMWDTQGLDYKLSQKDILNEIKRLVGEGLDNGPDHYINIILYCTLGERFQNEDGQLIYEIMQLYPLDNLPVVITQLQSYFKTKAKKMEEIIRKILDNYLEHEIVEKIEIKSVLARDFEDEDSGNAYKAYGIPELLRLSFDIMGRSISSATCDRISKDIEKLCKNFMDKKILYAQNLFKNEMEILEVAESLFVEDQENDADNNILDNENEKKELSELNIYKNIQDQNYYVDNFIKGIKDKFIDIFNNLENGNMLLDENKNDNEGENENQKNNAEENKEEKDDNAQNNMNVEENKEQEDDNDQNNINAEENKEQEDDNDQNNNINENIQQEQQENIQNENIINQQENNNEQNNINENNKQNENNQQEEEKEENEEEEEKNEEQKENEQEPIEQMEEKSPIVIFVEESLEKLKKTLDTASNKIFNKIFKERYNQYLDELLKEQKLKNEDFRDDRKVMDTSEVEKNYKEKLSIYFKNEYFKIFFCIILKLFMNNLKEILDKYVKEELTDNKEVQKIINEKAENALKDITENLKNNLISELDGLINEQKEIENKAKKENEFDNEDIDFAF